VDVFTSGINATRELEFYNVREPRYQMIFRHPGDVMNPPQLQALHETGDACVFPISWLTYHIHWLLNNLGLQYRLLTHNLTAFYPVTCGADPAANK